jgi:hypothetical protein
MQPQSNNPGKVIGIIGFIMAFLPLQLVGLILSIIGLVQSNKAGHTNGLAIAGIVLNSIGLLLVPLFLITIFAYAGITDRANTNAAAANASSAIKYSELYEAEYDKYPSSFTEMSLYANSTGSTVLDTLRLSPVPLTSYPNSVTMITFYVCGEAGNKAGYWDSDIGAEAYYFSGTVDHTTACVLTTE